jgi:superfamily II DNA or RNA helicase
MKKPAALPTRRAQYSVWHSNNSNAAQDSHPSESRQAPAGCGQPALAKKSLRPYQECGVADIRQCFGRGVRSVLYQSPTGSGKTILFAFIVAGATARGNRVVIIGHRDEIVRQVSAALVELDVPHGIIAAGYERTPAPVQVANVATLVRHLDEVHAPDLIVVDEAHHAVAGMWRKILAHWPSAKVLGVSATPERLSGEALSDVFDELVIGPSVGELVKQDFLSPFTTFAPARSPDLSGVRSRAGDFAVDQLSNAMSKGIIIDGAVDEYARLCSGVPAIVFCVDIDHSQLVAERFAARGFKAAHVDGNTEADERRDLIAALGTGEIQILCNCGLISEGLDVPSVVAVILLRPTKSLTLYMQQVGRALRPGKPKALILDHSGNTFRHGLVDAPRTWSLAGRPKGERQGEAPLCRCEQCAALNPIAALVCSECGAQLREPPSKRESRIGPLVELHHVATNHLTTMTYRQALLWAGNDLHRLRLVAQARGYKPGWIFKVLQERAAS